MIPTIKSMHLVHRSDLQVSRNRHHDFDEQIFTSAVDYLVYIHIRRSPSYGIYSVNIRIL